MSLHTQMGVFMADVMEEVERAKKKFPYTYCVTLAMCEESGELARAVLGQSDESIYKEAVQTVAMVFRIITEGDPSANQYRALNGITAGLTTPRKPCPYAGCSHPFKNTPPCALCYE